MFKCQVTGKMSKSGETCHKLVAVTRGRIYYRNVFNEDTNEWEPVEIGRGWEIAREINATAEGVALFEQMSPEDRELLVKEIR
jgi:hypothetical protein